MSLDCNVPDPEGHVRYGGDCVCGAVYTYNGIPEPGQFDPFCPDHGDPEYAATLREVRSCDCPMAPHHRWNCPLTPAFAQTIRDLDCNPWTVVRPRDVQPIPQLEVWRRQREKRAAQFNFVVASAINACVDALSYLWAGPVTDTTAVDDAWELAHAAGHAAHPNTVAALFGAATELDYYQEAL
ncbi:hypothetical protein [Mycolicibacterium vaccae]|uniref:hypothetical protein n=1 Tax=Mycolicibacterium vaccae TaxID=1810 RepID=UPI003D082767